MKIKFNKKIDVGLLIIRLSIGILILLHGLAKIVHGLDPIKGILKELGIPTIISYGAFVGEVIAPALIIIGLRTRIAAFILAINMFAALLLVHYNEIFSLSETGGWAIELVALYILCSVTLIFTGSGKYAVSSNHQWD